MRLLLALMAIMFSMSAVANECGSFTMQFVQVERVADAEKRLGVAEFDKNNDTIHSLVQYKYSSTGRPNETIQKNILATWIPSVADIDSVNGVYQPEKVREFFNVPMTEPVIDVVGFEDVADLEKCPTPTGLIADYKFLHTTKPQAAGVINRFINMMNNHGDGVKLLDGISEMIRDREALLVMLDDIKILIAMTDGTRD